MENELQEFLSNVGVGGINALTVSQKVLADGKTGATVELIRKVISPERMESPARAHMFFDSEGFSKYLKKTGSSNLVVLIDSVRQKVEAVVDDSAKNGFEKIRFEPQEHPQFLMLKKLLGHARSPKEFAEVIMRNRDVVVSVDGAEGRSGRDLALLMKQITVSNAVTIEEGVGDGAVNGVVVETKVRAGTGHTKVSLPETIGVKVPIYINTEPQEINLTVTVVPNGGEQIEIVVDAPELPVVIFNLFEKLMEPIKEIDGAFVSYGCINHSNWSYVR